MIARSLATGSNVILLDEPTANLDIDHVIETLTLLRELAVAGATIALALHDLNVVARWADAVAVLNAGRVHAAGPPGQVLDDELVASVFGVRVERLTAGDGRSTLVFHRRVPRGRDQTRSGRAALTPVCPTPHASRAVKRMGPCMVIRVAQTP